jgi:hypothetical protein
MVGHWCAARYAQRAAYGRRTAYLQTGPFRAVGIDAGGRAPLGSSSPDIGKTLLAKAVANESQAKFISVKGPELLNKVRRFSRNLPSWKSK